MRRRNGKNLARVSGGRGLRSNAILICYDGELTEDAYFRGWKQIISSTKAQIEPVFVKSGGNALKALKKTKKKVSGSRDAYKEIWCVCDVDDCSKETLLEAKTFANKNGIKLALSCRCFELWIKLHYGQYTRPFTNEKQAVDAVKEDIPEYGAPKKEAPFVLLLPRTGEAISNAKALKQMKLSNTYTDVHLVVAKLEKMTKR